VFASIFAIFVSYWVSISIAVLYFIGLLAVIIYSTKRGKMFEKRMLINMTLIIANLNQNAGEIYP
jgi:hypothetical protein